MSECIFCGKEASHVVMPKPGISHPICVHCIITMERLKVEGK